MLLEFGIQCIILTISDRQGLFITRWLLVRLMFHSGWYWNNVTCAFDQISMTLFQNSVRLQKA